MDNIDLEGTGLAEFLRSIDHDSNMEALVNGLANQLLDISVFDIDVFDPTDVIGTHFKKSGHDIDWYSLIRRDFRERFDIDEEVMILKDQMSANFDHEIRDQIESYLLEWHLRAKELFRTALDQ